MKSTGITRKVDELGRVVLPKELRDTLEIYVDGEKIILKKYEAGGACAITGEVSNRNVSLANGKITLSPEGIKLLMNELQQYLVK
ncbi:AbrB/MazE/SpoVT family DNA-binding domain-containing protein [Bacillus cereus]|uniref:AbrB/MazE/SpoVT family DNA-binding domain-containing protein n=1 Tax=Bacillus cereus TaxID=1396 RepID=UPI0034D51362